MWWSLWFNQFYNNANTVKWMKFDQIWHTLKEGFKGSNEFSFLNFELVHQKTLAIELTTVKL